MAPKGQIFQSALMIGIDTLSYFGKAETAGQAHRSAPYKIFYKSRGVYLTFIPLPAP